MNEQFHFYGIIFLLTFLAVVLFIFAIVGNYVFFQSIRNRGLVCGKHLDRIAFMHGMIRKKKFWFFKESDSKFRARMLAALRDVPRANLR